MNLLLKKFLKTLVILILMSITGLFFLYIFSTKSQIAVSAIEINYLLPKIKLRKTKIEQKKLKTSFQKSKFSLKNLFDKKFQGVSIDRVLSTFQNKNIINLFPAKIGGRCIKFFIIFKNKKDNFTARALFKLKHRHEHYTYPEGEVGTFLLSRLLGMNSVPPATLIKLSGGHLLKLLKQFKMTDEISKFKKEVLRMSDLLDGAALFWITGAKPFKLKLNDIKKYYHYYLKEPKKFKNIVLQLSDMIILDFLTGNYDRFSGGNILKYKDKLFFIDNGAAFNHKSKWISGFRHHILKNLYILKASTWNKLKKLNLATLEKSLYPLLSHNQIKEILARKTDLLHILKIRIHSNNSDNILNIHR